MRFKRTKSILVGMSLLMLCFSGVSSAEVLNTFTIQGDGFGWTEVNFGTGNITESLDSRFQCVLTSNDDGAGIYWKLDLNLPDLGVEETFVETGSSAGGRLAIDVEDNRAWVWAFKTKDSEDSTGDVEVLFTVDLNTLTGYVVAEGQTVDVTDSSIHIFWDHLGPITVSVPTE